ncbi:C1 family peptidase [Kaistella carnis]|uniref:Uncharacterized protein n=1 Tax=Kaistella carnis TaxID=1241979 RepID=A0A3G8XN48_9FLAO|nr:hypothetical protein [Kaistella carnis]AZI31694.1 hypothetical protein EIB73_00230 [Kaistella carnis]
MSIIRITEGEYRTEIEGGWTVFTDEFEAYAGTVSHFTAERETMFGIPDKAPKFIDNAYIPAVLINEGSDILYDIKNKDNHYWNLSVLLEENFRKPIVKQLKFKTPDPIIPVRFNIVKGNNLANDKDGGHITAKVYNSKGNKIETQVFKDLNYGGHFDFSWDKTKDIFQIQFFADDNDDFFNGGFENVLCGIFEIYKSDCQVCGEWEIIASVVPQYKYEGYQTDCHVATHAQLKSMGYKEGFPRYQISKAIRDKNKNFIKLEYNKEEFIKGGNYIKQALKQEIPVTVGIDNHQQITPGNPDLTTDHFVVIVGMGTDEKGNYFNFYDNADRDVGTSSQNKLYCVCKENKLEGHADPESGYLKGSVYTITSIRTSIKI